MIGFSSTDYQVTVRSTSPFVTYLLLFVCLVPLMFLEGLLGNDGGLGSIGLAGGDTFATSSFSLLDFNLDRGFMGITYLLWLSLDVEGRTSGAE